MQCQSKEWIIIKDQAGKEKGKKTCDNVATKRCRHNFYTCDKHNHNCKKEERIKL